MENRFIEIEVAGVFGNVLVVNLWRHYHKHAEHQRNEQPAKTLTGILLDGALAQCHVRTGPGNKQQQRHAPEVQPDHPIPEAAAEFVVFHVPVPRVKPHAGVEEQQY
ncbi:hypothetical protein QQ054_24400 [Oscillatoria amoena NRMC-F 0135]|nr:hypothetical protein [Oscillatoria amoena NRMC-F 0135]